MRVLITGGAGFVGKELIASLKDRTEVVVADLLRYGRPAWLTDTPEGFGFRQIDIRDGEAIGRVVADFRPDVVVHLAAIHYIPECDAHPGNAVATNVTGVVNVLAACPPGTRFVLASSGAVYKPDEAPHRELDSALEPADVYGWTKLHDENYVQLFAAERGISAGIVRLFNVIGPGETNPHLLPVIISQLRSGAKVIELGNTTPKRDYIDVIDVANGFAAVALGTNPVDSPCEIVNLGTGKQYSVDEIVERMHTVLGLDFEVKQVASRMRPVDRPFLCADITRIKDLFGWSPQHDLNETLQRTWANPEMLPSLEGRTI
jgi:UDP-glucose 4-epimerase